MDEVFCKACMAMTGTHIDDGAFDIDTPIGVETIRGIAERVTDCCESTNFYDDVEDAADNDGDVVQMLFDALETERKKNVNAERRLSDLLMANRELRYELDQLRKIIEGNNRKLDQIRLHQFNK